MGHQGAPCPQLPGHHFNQHFRKYEDDQMVFVDKSGVWTFSVSWCNCLSRPSRTNQLLEMGLYPATFRTPKTAFTIQLLDYFHFDLMECHTPAANFFSKLRRLTDNVSPKTVPVRNSILYCKESVFSMQIYITGSLSGAYGCCKAVGRHHGQKMGRNWPRPVLQSRRRATHSLLCTLSPAWY